MLKDLHRDGGACLSIGQGVVMVQEVKATGGGDSLELVVGQETAEIVPGSPQRIVENIVRVIHPVDPEDGLQAAFVEGRIVRHEGESFDEGFDLLPDIGEYRCILRIFRPESMDPPAEPLVILGFRMDQAVEPVHDLPVPDDDDSHAAYAAGTLLKGVKHKV